MEILVVDDSAFMRNLITKELSALGFQETEIHLASSGVEALRKLRTQPFDLLLLDIVMPGVDGISVLKEAKNLCPGSRVIMCTNFSPKETVEELIAIGIDDFLLKPFSSERFKQVVGRNLLGGSSIG